MTVLPLIGRMVYLGSLLLQAPTIVAAFVVTTSTSRPHSTGTGTLPSSTWSTQRPGTDTGTTPLQMSVPNSFDVLTSGLASIWCLPRGVTVTTTAAGRVLPASSYRILELYDVENDPQCRLVRERITELDRNVAQVIPMARGSQHTLPPAGMTPAANVPVMVVETRTTAVAEAATTTNTGGNENDHEVVAPSRRTIQGSAAILSFLEEDTVANQKQKESAEVENGTALFVAVAIEKFHKAGTYVATWMRWGRGECVSPAARPPKEHQQPLILYSYEGNQFCRLVREVLTELDLTYEVRSTGKGSRRRSELATLRPDGATQCPYLVDPNTDHALADSTEIVTYLYQTYAIYTPPNPLLAVISTYVLETIAKPIFQVLAPIQAGSNNNSDGEVTSSNAKTNYQQRIQQTIREIEAEVNIIPTTVATAAKTTTLDTVGIVVYTYEWSPFCSEATLLLDRLGVPYTEISLGKEWFPGLIDDSSTGTDADAIGAGGSLKRATLLEMTGQSSLPHIFVDGKSVGGLFSGTPGLIPLLNRGPMPFVRKL